MVWDFWRASVLLAKRAGCGVLVVDDFSGELRWNCHRFAVSRGKPDYGQWFLILRNSVRLRGRVPAIQVLGFGVLWDKRPTRVRRFHWLYPKFDNREYLQVQILAVRIATGPRNYG